MDTDKYSRHSRSQDLHYYLSEDIHQFFCMSRTVVLLVLPEAARGPPN